MWYSNNKDDHGDDHDDAFQSAFGHKMYKCFKFTNCLTGWLKNFMPCNKSRLLSALRVSS